MCLSDKVFPRPYSKEGSFFYVCAMVKAKHWVKGLRHSRCFVSIVLGERKLEVCFSSLPSFSSFLVSPCPFDSFYKAFFLTYLIAFAGGEGGKMDKTSRSRVKIKRVRDLRWIGKRSGDRHGGHTSAVSRPTATRWIASGASPASSSWARVGCLCLPDPSSRGSS